MKARARGDLKIGPAGWSYPDWHGLVYPRSKPHGFSELEYLSHFFDCIEINTSFYQPLRPDFVKAWLKQVEHNPRFQFTAKLWRRFTHDLGAGREDEKAAKQGLAPLLESGRLGALLLQFPWSFKNTPENRDYLASLFVQFIEYPLVVEVRHSSWNHPDVYRFLSDLGVGFCNIDQPLIGRSLPPSDRATSPVGYVRLHGRNYDQWFTADENSSPGERYNYLYSLAELDPWVKRIKAVAAQAQVTYVIANNHFEGKGVVNALELISLLTGQIVSAPQSLIERYPELQQVAVPESHGPSPQQGNLFFDAAKPIPR
jgi:uncharacterized protein YecE (DUF72 family)